LQHVRSHSRLPDHQPQTPLTGLASIEEFRAIIQKERKLADRSGRKLAILIYNTENAPPAELHQLLDALKQRIRETDDIGWMGVHELGILLRDTTYPGAEFLAQSLTQHLRVEHPPFAWTILCYPDNPEAFASITHPLPAWKRVTDIAVSAVGLLFLGPLLLLISIFIVIVAPGPVLFKQARMGYLGRRFMCLKFRSMKVNAPTQSHQDYLQHLIHSNSPMKKLDDAHDARLIPLGRLMRACALDELPQLFNVLRGDMSLVGPRPCLAYEYETYQRWHKRRFDTVPGLTGLWQVSGKNKTSFGEMIRLDIAYERRRSFLFDLMIMGKTPLVLVTQVSESLNPPSEEHVYESAH
jgi:lipopolysaccharide/colanic/teichoic acid biosynthesis glycosyltransferase